MEKVAFNKERHCMSFFLTDNVKYWFCYQTCKRLV